MPTLYSAVDILRYGQGVGKRDTSNCSDETVIVPRDHYLRYSCFNSKLYPKRPHIPFVEDAVAARAIAADRDSTLGIVDTVAREYITHWLAEAELLRMGKLQLNSAQLRVKWKMLSDGLRDNVIKVVERIGCDVNEDAVLLRVALIKCAGKHLRDLLDSYQHILEPAELKYFDPKGFSTDKTLCAPSANCSDKKTNLSYDFLSEADILNSSSAWALDSCTELPLGIRIKRQHSDAFSPGQLDLADAKVEFANLSTAKRQKFDDKTATVIDLINADCNTPLNSGYVNGLNMVQQRIGRRILSFRASMFALNRETI